MKVTVGVGVLLGVGVLVNVGVIVAVTVRFGVRVMVGVNDGVDVTPLVGVTDTFPDNVAHAGKFNKGSPTEINLLFLIITFVGVPPNSAYQPIPLVFSQVIFSTRILETLNPHVAP